MRKLFSRKPVWVILGLALVAALVLGVMALNGGDNQAQAVEPQFHGAGIKKFCVGPDGVTPKAREGDTVTCTIRVTNVDDFACALTINSISDVVHHASGDVSTGNLLAAPVILPAKEDFVDVSHSYVVEVGDNDPLRDTASSTGTDPVVGDFSLTYPGLIDIVHPEVSIDKTGDEVSKAGDEVNYTIEVCNDGEVTLENITVDDSLLGDLSGSYADTLAPGACESHVFPYTVLATDPDPLVNTATVRANPEGLTDVVSAQASAEVDLVHPDFQISKECSPDPVYVGDTITWTVTLENTGDVTLHIEVDDPTAGISETITLAPTASETITRSRPVTDADAPAISNTVTATATLDPALGLDNVIERSATDSCATGGPCIDVTKEADPETSKAGDSVDYPIEVCNCGDVTLENITVDDSLLGDLSDSYADTLAPDACESHVFPYTVLATDPDPLVNTVTVQANPEGLTNVVSAQASAEVDLVHPDFEISKECSPDPVYVGDTITWTVTLENTGDVTLIIEVDDPTADISETITLTAGASESITRSRPVTDADVPAISNTVTATATLDPALGLDNVIERSATDSCEMTTATPSPTPSPTPTALPAVETPAPTPTPIAAPVALPPTGGGPFGTGAGTTLWTILFLGGGAALLSTGVLALRGWKQRAE